MGAWIRRRRECDISWVSAFEEGDRGAMSGATLAAGPRMAREGKGRPGGTRENVSDFGGMGGVMGSFRVIELQLMAFIVVFSASGLVPLIDILFPVIISLYSVVLNKLVFPRYKNAELQVFQGNRAFQLYVVTGTVLGLFLPLAYVLGGFARNDQHSVRKATPHLFLLSCQVLSENLVSGLEIFSLPVRALMPILYNTRRLFALVDWCEELFLTRSLSDHPTVNVPIFRPFSLLLFYSICWTFFLGILGFDKVLGNALAFHDFALLGIFFCCIPLVSQRITL